MISCPLCNIQFSPGCLSCPGCGGYQTPLEERKRYRRQDAIQQIHAEVDPKSVRDDLIHSGFADLEADEIISSARKALRSENRWNGFIRLIVGIPLFVAGLASLVFAVLASQHQFLSGEALLYLFAGAGAATFCGGLACLSGLYAMLTGRESGIAPPEIH